MVIYQVYGKLRIVSKLQNPSVLKLPEEPAVIFIKQTNVFDAVFQQRDTFDTDAECEAGIFVAVDISGGEYVRVNHPGAKHFKPAAVFTDAAPFSFAEETLHVDLDTRFGERKKTGTYFDACFIIKETS